MEEKRSAGGLAVLVVDDEEIVLTTVKRFLELQGIAVYTACCGPEAIEVFRDRRQDLAGVLLDLGLAGMDGEEVFEALRRIEPGARIVLCSGVAQQDVVKRLEARGLAGVLGKPFRSSQLLEQVRALLDPDAPA